tara:strand:- start:364 stop:597 length:234 start_codon:yes stop_codon:yes gene_type:complete
MQVIPIDMLHPQTQQRLVDSFQQSFGASINYPLSIYTGHTALTGEMDVMEFGLKRLTNQGFIGAKAVECSGIKMPDT